MGKAKPLDPPLQVGFDHALAQVTMPKPPEPMVPRNVYRIFKNDVPIPPLREGRKQIFDSEYEAKEALKLALYKAFWDLWEYQTQDTGQKHYWGGAIHRYFYRLKADHSVEMDDRPLRKGWQLTQTRLLKEFEIRPIPFHVAVPLIMEDLQRVRA